MEKLNILIIEDLHLDKIIDTVNSLFIENVDIRGSANSFDEAVELILALHHEVDLILLDFFLDKSEHPGFSAPFLVDRVTEELGYFPTPVILVTDFERHARSMAYSKKYNSIVIGLIIKDLYLGLGFEEQIEGLFSAILNDRSMLMI